MRHVLSGKGRRWKLFWQEALTLSDAFRRLMCQLRNNENIVIHNRILRQINVYMLPTARSQYLSDLDFWYTWRGGCCSGGRAGCLVIRRLLVWIPPPASSVNGILWWSSVTDVLSPERNKTHTFSHFWIYQKAFIINSHSNVTQIHKCLRHVWLSLVCVCVCKYVCVNSLNSAVINKWPQREGKGEGNIATGKIEFSF